MWAEYGALMMLKMIPESRERIIDNYLMFLLSMEVLFYVIDMWHHQQLALMCQYLKNFLTLMVVMVASDRLTQRMQ